MTEQIKPIHWVFFTAYGECASLAYKAKQEGADVILAVVDDLKTVFADETPEQKKRRLKMYGGMVEKISAEKVMDKLAEVKDKDSYFLFFDLNCLYKYSEKCVEMGFKYGNFFTELDFKLEEDRAYAKEIVKKYYPGLMVAPVEEFKKVEDAKKFLEEDKGSIYVLKGNSEEAKTKVPRTKIETLAKDQIIERLEAEKEKYESKGFILERKIKNPMELTPQCVFMDGEPVFYDVDIESKYIGAGNTGFQVGCAQNLIRKIDGKDRICEIAFPPITKKWAKDHTGIFTIDASILIDPEDNQMYYGEFCPRFGWDAIYTEISMGRSVTGFFEDILNGIDPLIRERGAAVRAFNVARKPPYCYDGDDLMGKTCAFKDDRFLFMFYVEKDAEGKIVTTGYEPDLVVATGYGSKHDDAIKMAYDNLSMFAFDDHLYRPMEDFLDWYPESIMARNSLMKEMGLVRCEKI